MAGLHRNVPSTDATKTERFQRVEVITGVARRRAWSAEDKAAIVAESLVPGAVVAVVARRHAIHPNQLYSWRRALGIMPTGCGTPEPSGFVPVTVAPEPAPPTPTGGVIEVVVDTVTVRVTGVVDAVALRRVLEIVRRLA